MNPRSVVHAALFALIAPAVLAQLPTVGEPAPAIQAEKWINWQGDAPTVESLAGRVVMLEFWGTWCGPCVRAMPGVQKLHDRYQQRGLTVLAISYETAEKMQPFLSENAYTMPVASDPEKKTIAAYGIRSWPTTIVIGKDGKIAHVGSPYDAESAVEKALGLEAGPAALLNLYLDTLKGTDKAKQREALERLVEKAPRDFDLQSWAKGLCAPETVTADGKAGVPVPASAKPAGKPTEPMELLRRCAKAWINDAQRRPLLQQLADGGPTTFDLTTFAQESFAKAFPLDANELKTMLTEKKYADVVEGIMHRAPAAAVLTAAAKDSGLAAFCRSKASEARQMAKKGVMAQNWVFPGALPKDESVNSKFFGELSISGISTSKDKKTITGIMLGGVILKSEEAASFVTKQLTQALVMESLAAGKSPRLSDLTKDCDKERAALVSDLEGRYGKPEPRVAK